MCLKDLSAGGAVLSDAEQASSQGSLQLELG